MMTFLWIIALLAGVGAIVWGAEAFAEHLGKAAGRAESQQLRWTRLIHLVHSSRRRLLIVGSV
jgi:hypothetical protein